MQFIYPIYFVLLLILTRSSSARLRSCKNVGNGTTVCLALKNCRPLLRTISPSLITSEAVRRLQKLTCGFDQNEPRVCCPRERNAEASPLPQTLDSHPNSYLLPKPGVCGTINVPLADRIIGGTIPPLLAFPWIVRIGYKGRGKGTAYYCGGTLISERYILTAAHCVTSDDNVSSSPVSVLVGEHNSMSEPDCSTVSGKCSTAKTYGIDKVISHPEYRADTKFHDIALLRLSESVVIDNDYIYPICLPMAPEVMETMGRIGLKNSTTPRHGFVTGWGATRWDSMRQSSVLRYVVLPIIENDRCRNIYSGVTTITDMQMCAGALGGKDSCDGDSGGPFVVASEDMQYYYQIGIVSYGPARCGTEGLPSIYTRLSAYIPWILDNIEP